MVQVDEDGGWRRRTWLGLVAGVLLVIGCLVGPGVARWAYWKWRAIRPAGVEVRIVLAGDSTVTDDYGWGGEFKSLVTGKADCVNAASRGRSSRSYREDGGWAKALALKGDYVLIQLGHNDQRMEDPARGTDPATEYPVNLRRYVGDVRAGGAKPFLITPMTRREWGEDGKIHSSLVPWVEAMRRVAAEKNVPLIDLHARSIELWEGIGKEKSDAISPRRADGTIDPTHLTAAGAKLVAPIVAAELKQAVPELAGYLK